MAPTTHLPARVARRFQAAVLLRDQHETDEYIGTCSEGASVGTSEVLQLLVSRGIEPNEVRFTKRLADNMTRFEARTSTGTVKGTVTIKTKHTSEKIDAYAVITLDQDADGSPVPAAGVVGILVEELRDMADWIADRPEDIDAHAVVLRLQDIEGQVHLLGW